MVLNRRKTRTILNATETTAETESITDNPLSFILTTSDFFYVGFYGPFASRYFHFATANTNSATLTVEFWNGSAWESVDDLVDQTNGMTQDGFISWQNITTWQKMEQSPITSTSGQDLEMYWVRITTDADFSAGTSLQAVLNLYSDDELVRALYPEIISDSRFLPPGRTNFLEQHQQAKARVLRRLKQKGHIKDENQVIDVNAVAEASVHAFVDIVLSPMSTTENLNIILQRARNDFESELSRINLGIDKNEDGKVTRSERRLATGTVTRV